MKKSNDMDEEIKAPVDTGKLNSLSGGIDRHHTSTNLTSLIGEILANMTGGQPGSSIQILVNMTSLATQICLINMTRLPTKVLIS